jgi:hypothetical protein
MNGRRGDPRPAVQAPELDVDRIRGLRDDAHPGTAHRHHEADRRLQETRIDRTPFLGSLQHILARFHVDLEGRLDDGRLDLLATPEFPYLEAEHYIVRSIFSTTSNERKKTVAPSGPAPG